MRTLKGSGGARGVAHKDVVFSKVGWGQEGWFTGKLVGARLGCQFHRRLMAQMASS